MKNSERKKLLGKLKGGKVRGNSEKIMVRVNSERRGVTGNIARGRIEEILTRESMRILREE